ncbi:MAG: hypothetical protein Kapaf2KO_01240 [Candidatus Kapaibacteriales bacterium]
MKKFISLISLIVITLGLSSCEKVLDGNGDIEVDNDNLSNEEKLIFGVFFGECIGEGCIETYKLEYDIVYEDSLDTYPTMQSTDEESFSWYKYDHSTDTHLAAHDVFAVYRKHEDALWASESAIFGCPDCVDQGGVYIRIEKDNQTRTFMIDTGLLFNEENDNTLITDYMVEMGIAAFEGVEILKKGN